MLEPAYFNQDKLYEAYKKIYTEKNDLYLYIYYPQKDFYPYISNNDSEFLQFVSKDSKGNLLGFLTGYINRGYDLLEKFEVINFTRKPNIIFSKDIEAYFDEVFFYKNLRKIEFSCIEQNPVLDMYRRLVKKLNGHEIGIARESVKLTDGKYYNNVLFEIIREGYINFKNC